jgi:hypothetical protein
LVPGLRVVAPTSWSEERIRKALYRKFSCIGPVLILRKLHTDLVERVGRLRRVGYALPGESLSKAWESMTPYYGFRVLHLPSWRMEIFPAKERKEFRKVRNFPAQPQAEISVRYYRKRYYREGLHVIRVYIKNVQWQVLERHSHVFFSVMRDFLPMNWKYTPINRREVRRSHYVVVSPSFRIFDKGYEIVFAPISEVKAIRVLRKLVKILARRLIKKGFLSYRCDRKSEKPLPKSYLRFITQEELQILQSLMRD